MTAKKGKKTQSKIKETINVHVAVWQSKETNGGKEVFAKRD